MRKNNSDKVVVHFYSLFEEKYGTMVNIIGAFPWDYPYRYATLRYLGGHFGFNSDFDLTLFDKIVPYCNRKVKYLEN